MRASQTEYRVAEGAAFLGCHPNTLRNLDRVGVIKARRNYLGYRIFRLVDLLKLKEERQQLIEEK